MIAKDEFTADGTRLFNPTRPHGTVYGGGPEDGRWVQDGIVYAGDRKPVGYVEQLADAKVAKKG